MHFWSVMRKDEIASRSSNTTEQARISGQCKRCVKPTHHDEVRNGRTSILSHLTVSVLIDSTSRVQQHAIFVTLHANQF